MIMYDLAFPIISSTSGPVPATTRNCRLLLIRIGTLHPSVMASIASQPAAGSIAHARLLTPLGFRNSTVGERVDVVLEEPLFSDDPQISTPQRHLSRRLRNGVQESWLVPSQRTSPSNFQNVQMSPQMIA